MGYTHYWTQKRNFTRKAWAEISDDIATILKDVQHVQGVVLADWNGSAGTQPEFEADQISFNGLGDNSHESFTVDRVRAPKQAWEKHSGDGFCKTARKPYDLAVTAVLCYLATVAETHDVTSDGHGKNWLEGLAEARRALPRYANVLDIPRGILENDRWIGPWAHLQTEAYSFKFCVDGHAYINAVKNKLWYRFPDHVEAARFFKKHEAIISPTGFFDATRNKHLVRDQNALFAQFFALGGENLERHIAPPAFVRPNAFPAMEESRYVDFEQLLAQFAS